VGAIALHDLHPQKMRSHHQIAVAIMVVEIVVARPGEPEAEGEAKEALREVGGCLLLAVLWVLLQGGACALMAPVEGGKGMGGAAHLQIRRLGQEQTARTIVLAAAALAAASVGRGRGDDCSVDCGRCVNGHSFACCCCVNYCCCSCRSSCVFFIEQRWLQLLHAFGFRSNDLCNVCCK